MPNSESFDTIGGVVAWLDEKSNNNEKMRAILLSGWLGELLEEELKADGFFSDRKLLSDWNTYIVIKLEEIIKKGKKERIEVDKLTFKIKDNEEEIVRSCVKLYKKHKKKEPEIEKKDFKEKEINIVWLDPDTIKPSPQQKREVFLNIESLADSIKLHGQKDAISVSKSRTLIDGERRLRAGKLIREKDPSFKIKAEIVDKEDSEIDFLGEGVLANIQRDNYDPISLAKAFCDIATQIKKTNKFMDYSKIVTRQLTQTQINDRFFFTSEITQTIKAVTGFAPSTIYKMIKNLKEKEEIQEVIRKGEVGSFGGEFVMKLNKEDFSDELITQIKKTKARDKIIKGLEKKAKDVKDVSTLYLLIFKFLEANPKKIIKQLDALDLKEVSKENKKSVKNRTIKYIQFLMNKLNINKEEL